MKQAILRLKDGTEFNGIQFGAPVDLATGEVVFNTGIPGYQEILTDPSYQGQIVTLTSPMIGNYGIDVSDNESSGIKATAFIIRKLYRGPLMPGRKSLDDFLSEQGIIGLEGIDTRALTLHLRDNGSQNGIIFYPEDRDKAIAKLESFPSITERDLIDEVAVHKAVTCPSLGEGFIQAPTSPSKHIALVDFGIKRSIIENFYKRNAAVTLLPPTASAKDILDLDPDLLFLSNGPGDPALLKSQADMVRSLLGKLPIAGICLGHQIITHAIGGTTVKMKFGHHGSNQPVRDTFTGKTFVTAQNHGFMSNRASLPKGTTIWFENANDGSVEGLINEDLKVMSVQFHPEAAPGPLEAAEIFDAFLRSAK